MDTSALGKALVFIGLLVMSLGLVFVMVPKVPILGKLPGDFVYQSGNIKVYAPLATCFLVSLLITIVLNLIIGRK